MRLDHHFLHSLFNNRDMSWQIALTELIDNALDQAAKTVEIEWATGDVFHIGDSGYGVSPEGFKALWTLGGHLKQPRKDGSGAYGIGFKEAAGWLWGVTRIESRYEGVIRTMTIDWAKEVRKGVTLDDPNITTKTSHGRSYTWIVCRQTKRKPPTPDQLTRLYDELAHVYRPALLAGASIRLTRYGNTAPVVAPAWPEIEPHLPSVNGTIMVKGRAVHVQATVTRESQARPGVYIAKAGRAMDRLVTGFPSSHIYGWATLGQEWIAGKNKTELTDLYRPALMAAIEDYCREVLKAAAEQARVVKLIGLEQTVNFLLRNGLANTLLVPAGPGTDLYKRPRGKRPVTPKPDKTEDPTASDKANKPRTPPNPNRGLRSKDGTVPEIEVVFGNTRPGVLTNYELTPTHWKATIDQRHPYVQSYIEERVLGARGTDPMRLVHHVVTGLAAQAVHNPIAISAMPWLEGEPPNQIYEMALARMWHDVLGIRMEETEERTIGGESLDVGDVADDPSLNP